MNLHCRPTLVAEMLPRLSNLDFECNYTLMNCYNTIMKAIAMMQQRQNPNIVNEDFFPKLAESLAELAKNIEEGKSTFDTLEKIVGDYEIDVLINNAYDLSPKTGFNIADGRLENSSYQQWQSSFEAGVYWAVLASQTIGRQFRKKGKGSIINISSMYGIVSSSPALYEGRDFFNPPSYGVIKSGLLALTRYTASFWAQYGVCCNAIAPGAFPNVESQSTNQ